MPVYPLPIRSLAPLREESRVNLTPRRKGAEMKKEPKQLPFAP
jgi:hypothetical protein